MPGEVIEGHAKFEDQCGKCHKSFEKSSQVRLCLDCHKDVAQDLETGKGFHGLRPDIKGTECKHCHTDHKGRDEDIVQLDPDTFNHKLTDFLLEGAHTQVACAGCHAAGKKHRDAPGQCVDCHKEDDPHKGRLGEKCADCHVTEAWAQAKFDHDKTDFPLKGTHKKVKCESCHAGERYKATPKACVECHRLEDAHQGRFGKKCETCHEPKAWKEIKFDHNRDTKFDLVGRHTKLQCNNCHTGPLYEQDLGTKCVDCHKNDDVHKGRNGKKCNDCHTPRDWQKVGFDHNKDTKFPLEGRHAKLQCEDCHRGQVFEEKLQKTCVSCHQLDDVHRGSLGKDCASCHLFSEWKKVRFDHNRDTDFPLKQRHAELKCRDCHKGPDPKKEKLGTACYDCHREDDVHKGQQGKKCELCHNEVTWSAEVFFDHDLTRFPLIGLHATVPCEECHLTPAFKDAELDCASCHESDDVHKRRLGPSCELCHNPNGWAFWRFDHDTQTDFTLDGSHVGLKCEACHNEPVDQEISLSKTCIACHRKDDVHRGSFGRSCDRCHVTESFEQIKRTP